MLFIENENCESVRNTENYEKKKKKMSDFISDYKKCLENDPKLVDFYQSGKGHLSHSSLKKFRESPFEFLKYKTLPKAGSKAMSDGKMMHLLLFKPLEFKNDYYAIDDREKCKEISGDDWKEKGKKPRSTTVYKKWLAEYVAKFPGKQSVDIDQLFMIKGAIDRAMSNPEFNAIIAEMNSSTTREQTVIDEIDGYQIKGILDITTGSTTADLKFVTDNSDRAVYRDYWGDKYWSWVQQGLYGYMNSFKTKHHKMIYMNKFGDVNIRPVPLESLKRGFDEFRYWIKEFDTCLHEKGTFNIDSSYWKKGDNALYTPTWLDQEE